MKKIPYFLLAILILVFTALELPLFDERSSFENAAERQAQTAGIVRMFCLDPSRFVFDTPVLPFGWRPFNFEFALVEWTEARAAQAIYGHCDSVEPIVRLGAIFFAALGLLGVFLLGSYLLMTPWAGLLCALVLSVDWLWMKYASFTMVDSRTVSFGILAMACAFYKRPVLAGIFWFFTLAQKPQAFTFIGTFYLGLELFLFKMKSIKKPLQDPKLRARFWALVFGVLPALAYHGYSAGVNAQSDLPWLTWVGPRVNKWFFGDWAERFQWAFYKSSFFEWFRKTGIGVALASIFLAALFLRKNKKELKHLVYLCLGLSLVFFTARFANVFIFLNVFKAHEYYAIPQNGFGALTKGLMFSLVGLYVFKLLDEKYKMVLTLLPIVVFLTVDSTKNVLSFLKFRHDVQDPASSIYYQEWEQSIFPQKNSFVAIANPTRGRDYMLLYLNHQTGHVWCHQNKEFAPRAFWKAEGVQYVAWPESVDSQMKVQKWIVRTMEEELAYARQMGWSSDVNDVWAGRTMTEWAALASRGFKDPCEEGEFDPRLW